MKSALINIFVFAAGAAIGSVATWKLVETKYKKIAEEEINTVKEVYRTLHAEEELAKGFKEGLENVQSVQSIEEETDAIKKECETIIENMGYRNYSTPITKEEKGGSEPMEKIDKPYVISPEEFDEIEGYEPISLIYFADNVLTDENYDLVEDVDDVVGFDSLETFGMYEDDSVFVRNDRLKADYEILRDTRTYSEVTNPYHED